MQDIFPHGPFVSVCVFFGMFLFGAGYGLEHFYSSSVSDVDDPHSLLPGFFFLVLGSFFLSHVVC